MVDAGLLRPADPHQVSLTLWAHGHGMISLYHRGLLGVDTEEEFRALMTTSFLRIARGLGTDRFEKVAERLYPARGSTSEEWSVGGRGGGDLERQGTEPVSV
jgi:hypothetical protein